MITANDQNTHANNKDKDIQNSNETLIDQYETVQDRSNLNSINDSTNIPSARNNKESVEDGFYDSNET